MRERARNAVRGSVGFAIGVFFAVSLAFFGFRILSLILGSAIAGGSLAWERSFRFIVLASLGAVLGLLLGGLLVLMSFGTAHAYEYKLQFTPPSGARGVND